ncbi:dTDP-glucose 4,6-dehydratase [Eubacterium maltosivorans]|uniref:dTDP-glucose 4,6-dehydratase n=1 Tax=Eubacterium maltosivorans TaxID=2041044 RepID=A0A4P9C7T4_EUBML|nr:dTDP-glucose 4,6-dehydratase [Eubacterium maltosivorans]QCT71598.1 dTDP-glucose 4,6-dehydratase [Eubacterium maltosivorans]
MKTVLVTGGAGFIGSNFVKYMLDQHKDYKIVNLDLLTYAGNLENLTDIEDNPNYEFVKGDIADRSFINDLFEKYHFDLVVNFAAESHVDRSIENPEIFVQTNVMGTQVLLDAAKNLWQTGKDENGYPTYREGVKYLQVSTDEVYGALGKTGMFTETTPIQPNSPYSSSKAGADLLVRAYGNTFKFPMNITRCSNNYGPYQFPEKLIPLMISNVVELKNLPIYGDGMQIRDWLHVKDHCSGIDTVLHKGRLGEVYNIGGNNEKANIEIVDLIIANVKEKLSKNQYNGIDTDASTISDDLKIHVEDRLGHDRRYAIDNTKITTELGWSPSYTFEQGIVETIDWYLNNQDWLKQVKSGGYQEYYEKMYSKK